MIVAIFIEPHERYEAVEAYRDRLTPEQLEQIEEAPENARIKLTFGIGYADTVVTIIPEG